MIHLLTNKNGRLQEAVVVDEAANPCGDADLQDSLPHPFLFVRHNGGGGQLTT